MTTPTTQPRTGDQEACEELDEIRLDVEALTGHPIEVRPVPYGRGVFAKRRHISKIRSRIRFRQEKLIPD